MITKYYFIMKHFKSFKIKKHTLHYYSVRSFLVKINFNKTHLLVYTDKFVNCILNIG